MKHLGKLLKDDQGYGIVLERVYNHTVERVWDALTDPAKMTMWFLKAEWDFRPGGRIAFTFPDEAKTRTYGTFTAIEPLRLMEFIWHNDDGHRMSWRDGNSLIRVVKPGWCSPIPGFRKTWQPVFQRDGILFSTTLATSWTGSVK